MYNKKLEIFNITADPKLMPTRANPTDAGLDLRASKDIWLKANIRTLIPTGIKVKIPVNYVGLLAPRSSLSKYGIIMTNSVGIIDSDYRGELLISVCFIQMSAEQFNVSQIKVEKYERLAQLVITPMELFELKEFLGSTEEWEDTNRGSGGFGSSGKF